MKKSIYYRLKECAGMADVIEAAESGYIALNDDSIGHLKDALYKQLIEIANSIKAPAELALHRE